MLEDIPGKRKMRLYKYNSHGYTIYEMLSTKNVETSESLRRKNLEAEKRYKFNEFLKLKRICLFKSESFRATKKLNISVGM